MGISTRTVYKWRKRFREEGLAGLQNRASRPRRSPARIAAPIETEVIRLRRERRTMDRVTAQTGLSRATVGRILARHGLNRWRDLVPVERVVRYEPAAPGGLIHIDIKKLGKFSCTGHRITGDFQLSKSHDIGWEFVQLNLPTTPARLQSSAGQRAKGGCRGLPRGRHRLVSRPGHQGAAGDVR